MYLAIAAFAVRLLDIVEVFNNFNKYIPESQFFLSTVPLKAMTM
jgi:hypothetical protein